MYPGGQAVTLDLQWRPVRVLLEGEDSPRTIVMAHGIKVDLADEGQMTMNRYVRVCVFVCQWKYFCVYVCVFVCGCTERLMSG